MAASGEEAVYATEDMEAEIEYQKAQGELSEEIEGLNASLALKQALLAQHGEEHGGEDGEAAQDVATLCDAAELERASRASRASATPSTAR